MNKSIKYFFLFLFSCSFFLLEGKEPPDKSNRLVNDFVGVMNSGEINALERKLIAYDDSTSNQISIVIENSLEGDEVFDYSYRLAEKWGIGREGKDNGLLVFVSIQDRELFIHVGPGLQGKITDNISRRIISNVLVPSFRQEQYYQGLDRATELIIQLASGEFTNDGSGRRATEFPWQILVFLAVLIFIVYMNRGDDEDDGGGYYGDGRYDYDRPTRRRRRGRGGVIIFPGGFGGGGGGWSDGGGFGGGGFGGFGGGGFDGGGAGGSW